MTIKRKRLTWNQKVLRWSFRYLADLSDPELKDFITELTAFRAQDRFYQHQMLRNLLQNSRLASLINPPSHM